MEKKPRKRRTAYGNTPKPKKAEPVVEVKREPEVRRYFGSGVVYKSGTRLVFDKETHTLDTDNPDEWQLLDQCGFKWGPATQHMDVPEKVDPLYEPSLNVNMSKT